MTPGMFFQLILGVLQFPAQMSSLLKMLQSTPAEQHDALVKSMISEAENFKKTGRPTWG